jgi:hypothetical protein
VTCAMIKNLYPTTLLLIDLDGQHSKPKLPPEAQTLGLV